ncbi:MAG TPA: DUF3052 family protein [Longimicrobiales bacterium]|nr:DUF3052 family protein [Longimicrobiales bacterium]
MASGPATPAGYSGTPLPRKLGIKDGHRVLLSGAPAGFRDTLGTLPGDVTLATRAARRDFDVILLFAKDEARLAARLAALKERIHSAGAIWLCWPKKASGVRTDLDGNVVRGTGLAAGLVDVKVCAVDETWSGLRFVYRVADRP